MVKQEGSRGWGGEERKKGEKKAKYLAPKDGWARGEGGEGEDVTKRRVKR